MNTISEGYPFCFAMKDSSTIYLYVLVKVPAGMTIQFPTAGRLDGQIKAFDITLAGTASTPGNGVNQYMHYAFNMNENSQTINTIMVITKPSTPPSAKAIGTMTIAVDIMEEVGNPSSLPTLSNITDPALDTPYVCTKLNQTGPNILGFDTEIYVLSGTPKQFSNNQGEPSGTDIMDTLSTITGSGTTGSLDYSVNHTYDIPSVHTTKGAHSANYNNGRKGKTKNKHHNKTPFPRLRRKPKA